MTTSVTQTPGSYTGSWASNQREILIYLFIVSFCLLSAFIWAIFFQYVMPRPNLLVLGKLTDFPVSSEPYEYIGEHDKLFIVHTNQQLSVLDPHIPYPKIRCSVWWNSADQRFEDPCLGIKFALNGGYLDGPQFGHLAQYPVQIMDNGKLYVDLSAPLVELKAEFIHRCLIAQHSGTEMRLKHTWGADFVETDCKDFWQNTPHDQVIH